MAREREMPVSLDELFSVIVDFGSYPKFLSEVVAVHASGGSAERPVVTFELEIVKRFQYTLEFRIREREEITWKLVKSNFFKVNEGRWLLKTVDPSRTLARYELDVDFGFFVPGWISKKLTEVNLPRMLESFEKRTIAVGRQRGKL